MSVVKPFAAPPQPLVSIERDDPLSRKAYHALRRAIRQRTLLPGSLYSEAQLAALLGVSRTPVREALIELAGEGVVDKIRQRGFRLRLPSAAELREAFDLRERVETYVVERLAAEGATGALDAAAALLENQAAAIGDRALFLEIDEQFHGALAEALGLERSKQMLLSLRSVISISGAAALEDVNRTMETVLEEHRHVVRCIVRRNAVEAAEAIRLHIRRTADAAERNLVSDSRSGTEQSRLDAIQR